MAIIVRPSVFIGGVEVACHAEALDEAPVVIRGFEIDWGREDYQSASTSPSSAKLFITDATQDWARRIRESRAIGSTVEIKWTATIKGGASSAALPPVTMFRGRVQTARAIPMDRFTDDGRRRWEIELTAADRTADYGNGIAGPTEWPVETMRQRAVKIRNLGLAAGSGIDAVYFWPGYQDQTTWPLDVKSKDGLALLAEFYASMGNDSYSYDPDENVIRQAIRLSQPLTVGLGAFDDDLGAVYPVPSDITVDGVDYPGVALGGCQLEGQPEITADPATDINRLECQWKDQLTDHKDVTTIKENVRPGDARRVMSWTSWLRFGEAIDPTLENVWNRAREEGARPRHPDITIRPTHEFPTERLAKWLLQAWENTRPAYIAGSAAYEWLLGDEASYSPIVAPIGGSTRFDPVKGWSATFRVHWVHNSSAAAPSATWKSLEQIRYSTSTPSVPWWYPILGIPAPPPVQVGERTPERDLTWGEVAADAGYRFADSVTWGDMRQVNSTGTQIKDY